MLPTEVSEHVIPVWLSPRNAREKLVGELIAGILQQQLLSEIEVALISAWLFLLLILPPK